MLEYKNPVSIYKGGQKMTIYSSQYYHPVNIYRGGKQRGSDFSLFRSTINIYSGSSDDGYSSESQILSYFWTGAVSQEWTLTGNWSNGMIPTITSNVIIPSNVPMFPYLINGHMNIGQNPNDADYICQRINIKSGALLTLNNMATLFNYGSVEINGILSIENLDVGSFTNKPGGGLIIVSGGLLKFE